MLALHTQIKYIYGSFEAKPRLMLDNNYVDTDVID
jgi:hypothetical protein